MAIDRPFEIKYKTTYDGAGSDAATQGLKKVTGAAGEAGDALKSGGAKAEESSRNFLEHSESTRKLREALHLLGPEFEALGEATRFFSNPLIAGIGVALVLFQKFRESLGATNKQLDEMAASAAKPVGDMLEAQAKAASDAAAAHERFAEALERTESVEGEINRGMTARISLYGQELDWLKKLAEARQKAAEQQIALDKQAGKITAEQAQAAREALEQSEKAYEGKLDRAKTENELAQSQKALADAEAARAAAPGEESSLESRRKTAEGRMNYTGDSKTKDALKEIEKQKQDELDKAIAAAEEAERRLQETQQSTHSWNPEWRTQAQADLPAMKKAAEDANKRVEEASTARDLARQAIKSNDEANKRATKEFNELTKQLDDLTSNTKGLTDTIASLSDKIKQLQAQLALAAKYQPMIDAAESGQPFSAGGGQPSGSTGHGLAISGTDSRIMDLTRRAHDAVAQQSRPGEAGVVADLLAQIIAMSQNHFSLTQEQGQSLKQLRNEVERLNSQIRNNRSNG